MVQYSFNDWLKKKILSDSAAKAKKVLEIVYKKLTPGLAEAPVSELQQKIREIVDHLKGEKAGKLSESYTWQLILTFMSRMNNSSWNQSALHSRHRLGNQK